MDPHIHNIHEIIGERYEEIAGLPEPVIERQHRTSSSAHETFRAISRVPKFTSVAFRRCSVPVLAPM